MNPARLKAYILLLIVTAIWGLAGPIIKFTLGDLPAAIFLTYRFAISSAVAVITFFLCGVHFPKEKRTLAKLFLYTFLTSTVSLGLLFFGLENTNVLDMTLITLIGPLLTATAGVLFLHEHVTQRERIGMGLALIGTLFAVIEPLFFKGGGALRFSGNILILLYLLTTTWAAILVKEVLREEVPPLTIANLSFLVGLVTITPVALFQHGFAGISQNLKNLTLPVHLGVWYMALLSGSLAYYLANRAQKTIEVSEAAVFAYLYPLFATPLAVLWLGEKITPGFIVGATVIAIGVFIAEVKKKRYNS